MSTKIERLINLIAILSDTMRPLTQKEIVSTVPGYNPSKSTSRRTFERDKDELRKLGFDIIQTPTPDGDYGYRINKENTYYSVSLTPSQRNILQCAIAMYSSNEAITSKSLTKLGGSSPENEIDSVISIPLPENVDLLFMLCSKAACISFKFRDTIRKVKTIKLLAKGGYWYLDCLDLDKLESRSFRIDRLSEIKEIENINIENKDFTNEQISENENIEIKVKLDPQIEKLFLKDWNAQLVEKDEYIFKVPRTEIFLLRYFDYLGYVTVLEPVELNNEIDDIFTNVSDLLGAN